MVTVEIRIDEDLVKVRRFGSGEFKRWSVLRPGDDDQLTGRSHEELRHLGEGMWAFTDVAETTRLTPAMA
jgi:hypothetical protein